MPNALQNNSTLNIKKESVRCGEIYCHSTSEFTIHCEFCELKSSEYEIFRLHFNLMHSHNIPLLRGKNDENILVDANEVFIEEQNSEGLFATETSQIVESQLKYECFPNLKKSEAAKDITGIRTDFTDKNTCDQFSINGKIKTKKTRKPCRECACEYCGKIYKKSSSLKNHISLEHDTNEPSYPVKCRECSEEFPNNHLLNKHCMDEHNGINCSYCNRKFKHRSHLNRHMVEKHSHYNFAKFECGFENCTKRFYTKTNLKCHQSLHNTPKNFVCDVCGFSCQRGNTLRSHYKVHVDERPYTCTVCHAKFKRKNQFNTHVGIHYRDERSFFCDFKECTKSFFTGPQLEIHKRRHVMPKKHVCDVCSYSTKHKQSLQIHYRKHTGEEPEQTKSIADYLSESISTVSHV